MHKYDHHIGDYTRDTVGLAMIEDGAYRRLLDQCYASEMPLPPERVELYRMARAVTPAERKAVDYVLGRYFVLRDDGWHQNRADRELGGFHGKSDKAKAAADARWERERLKQANGHANASTEHMRNECSDDANASETHAENNANASNPHGIRNASRALAGAGNRPPPSTLHPPKVKNKARPFEPPDWVPRQEWDDFDEMRQRKSGKAWTPRARELAVRKLDELRAAGQDTAAVLRQSVLRSWSGLFPVDNDRSSQPPPNSVHAKRSATAKAMYSNRETDEQDDDIPGDAERLD